jgi:hypothetical protein
LIDPALRDSNRHHRCYRLVPVIPQLHTMSASSQSHLETQQSCHYDFKGGYIDGYILILLLVPRGWMLHPLLNLPRYLRCSR